MQKYRVFISYARNDKNFVDGIAKILEENMLTPIYDKDIPGGRPFDENIKKYITQSHVFMPVITEESSKRGWVHEEIGYAMALNIPVLPVVIKEQQPVAMLQMLNAVLIDEKLTDAKQKLSHDAFDELLQDCGPNISTFLCRVLPEERALLMAEYADDVRRLGYRAILRQKGGLSSFQIPNESIKNRVWDDRYDPYVKNEYHCECQLKERRALEKHALEAGCKLIINPSLVTLERFSKTSQTARLTTFLQFLNTIQDDRIDVVIDSDLTFNESLTILGDWFSAESYYRPETGGFKQTMFSRHAPGIKSKVEAFDSEFDTLMKMSGFKAGESRQNVICFLEDMLDKIKRSKERLKIEQY